MREDIVFENQPRVQIVKTNGKSSGHPPKPKSSSSWGSQIVKGFVTEKKSKNQASIPSRKPSMETASLEICIQKNQTAACQSRVKRSLMSDLSVNSAQVHPHALDSRLRSPSSHDLFIELDHLRSLLRDSKDRESVLQSQLLQYKENPRVLELEKELEAKKVEVDWLNRRVGSLEAEKENLSEQLESVDSILKNQKDSSSLEGSRNLEMEVVALRRLNKELQLQSRNLAYKLSSTESQHAVLAKITESEVLAKVQEEASRLRHTNGSLSKQVEDLQMSRLTEVEELAYLRWVNSCLRNELSNSESLSIDVSNIDNDMRIKYKNANKTSEGDNKVCLNQKISKGLEYQAILDKEWIDAQASTSPRRRHSISGTKGCFEEIIVNKRRQSDGFIYPKEEEKDSNQLVHQKSEPCKTFAIDVEKRALRVPKPPPRPSTSIPNPTKENASIPPPPPPPPPPPKFSNKSNGVMQRAPEVAELYHSLMKRESRKENTNCTSCEAPNVANVRSSMIDEIENRSSHLLAIKADVETQGEFVNSLIKEVNSAAYQDIEDVVAFVKWLDDELCFLVDERAVLKHFDWPEKKADTLREAAFGYRDLKKLEAEITNYKDDPRIPCDIALKKMVTLSEKMERSVYNLLRTRDAMMRHCKEFYVPTDWMLDNGIVSKIKFASVKLAKKYMKRVANELHANGAANKDPALEYMLLQGVRFAFRIHQFAGGFDSETMHAFEELRNLAHVRKKL